MNDQLKRRDFLFYGGATIVGITLGELGRRQLARAEERANAWRERGVETWATSVCRECPAACGVRVRLVDAVPVKLDGNPLCPVARGRLCPKGQAALEAYFDPDRLLGPARRVGKRGEGRWERLTWPAAIALLAPRVSASSGPEMALALAAEERGPLAEAWATFWTAAGARVAWTPAATASRFASRLGALTGRRADPLFDLEHASHVLSFGAPIVEDWLSPVWSQRSYGHFRRGVAHARGRLVQVDFRRSLTARKADEWLPVRGDRQAALAWGIAAALLREGRASRSFLDEVGGDVATFANEVVARYSPDDVAAATGVPVVTILRLARELAGSAQPLVVVGADADASLVDAVFALDALLGAFDRPGGVLAAPTASRADPDDARAALHDVIDGSLRPKLLVFKDASPLRTLSAPSEPGAVLEHVPFIVSFSPYLDETSLVADLVLPAPTSLECWHAVVPPSAAPFDAVALSRPAVTARLDTKDTLAVLKAVADAAGGPLAAACTWQSSEDLVGAETDQRWKERRGSPYRNRYETAWLLQLENGGWWTPPAASAEEFQSVVLDAGGWADPFVASQQIRDALRARGGLTFTLPEGLAVAGRPGASKDSEDGKYPLHLVPFTPTVVNLAGSPNQPVLFELLGQPDGAPWQVWAELAPETARSLSIDPGAGIRIEAPAGSIEAVALIAEGMLAGTVALAFVPSLPGGGRWARLTHADARRLWGKTAFGGSCAVRIRRA
jgi:anaerobic selenocysteine-containing dehydrogenase